MTLLFFSISGLDVLECLQTSLNEERRQEIIGNLSSLISDPKILQEFLDNSCCKLGL